MSTEFLIALLLAGGVVYLYRVHSRKKNAPAKKPSEFKIGSDYAFGLGFPQMDALAAEVFSRSAKEGNVESYAALGNMYSRGVHFKKDYEEAAKWYKLAADEGHPTAIFQLSIFYLEGYGVPIDEQKFLELLFKAAELGEPTAQSTLGSILTLGAYGQETDPAKGLSWYMKAAQHGNALAQLKVGDAYFGGVLIHRDHQKALEYLTKAANQNDVQAIQRLGLVLDVGSEEIQPDKAASFQWYMKGASLNDAECQYGVAMAYFAGDGVEQNFEQAVDWLTKAANNGYDRAQHTIGFMLLRGIHCPVDIEYAKYWFEKAAALGNQEAAGELAKLVGTT